MRHCVAMCGIQCLKYNAIKTATMMMIDTAVI